MLKKTESLSPKKFPILFLALIAFMGCTHFFNYEQEALLVNILISLVVMASAYTLSGDDKLHRFILALATVFILSRWAGSFFVSDVIRVISLLLMVIYFVYIIKGVVQFLIASNDVDLNVILGCVAAYLMIGIMISFTFALLLEFNPHAFSLPANQMNYSNILYFTMISFTTIGFGDITPEASMAKMLTYFSGVVGQMYMGIVTAIIVGKFIQRIK
jgi:hypothetical protein